MKTNPYAPAEPNQESFRKGLILRGGFSKRERCAIQIMSNMVSVNASIPERAKFAVQMTDALFVALNEGQEL